MTIQWHSLLFKILIWCALEIILTLLGFDDLADYSEFILENKRVYAEQVYDLSNSLKFHKSYILVLSSQNYSLPFTISPQY